MEFTNFQAGVKAYGCGGQPPPDMPQEDNVNFYDPEMDADLAAQDRPNHDALVRVLMFLGLCHTIVID